MSRWDINPEGVRSVVIKTGNVAKKLEGEAKSYIGHMQSAATAAGTLSQAGKAPQGGLVAVALGEFAQNTESMLRYLGDRTSKSLQGTVDATTAYIHGDLTMAADAQANAERSPYDDPQPPRRGGPR